MGVAVGLGPITGLPLPLVSMGGTSLLFTGLAIGIVLSVSKGENQEQLLGDVGAENAPIPTAPEPMFENTEMVEQA